LEGSWVYFRGAADRRCRAQIIADMLRFLVFIFCGVPNGTI
jgi:hypothetical protein